MKLGAPAIAVRLAFAIVAFVLLPSIAGGPLQAAEIVRLKETEIVRLKADATRTQQSAADLRAAALALAYNLDHDQAGTIIDQCAKRSEQFIDVVEMEAGRRFVENK